MKVNKKKVIEEVAKIHGVELCRLDMLVRMDEYERKFFACDECMFKDISGVISICPYKCVNNHRGVIILK